MVDGGGGGGPKALVLLSGGIDSAVALWWALSRGWDIQCLTFNYHRRPEAELRACRALLRSVALPPMTEIQLPFMREVTDMDPGETAPGLSEAPEGYIPARNLVFYALALHEAERLGARYIVGGHNGGDSEVFPDASPGFFDLLNRLAEVALWSAAANRIEILVPFAGMPKAEVLRLGLDLGVPLVETWSCYWDGDVPCGVCESCVERSEAFGSLGMEDPAPSAPRGAMGEQTS